LGVDPEVHRHATGAVLDAGEWSGRLLHHRRDGSALPVEANWTLVRDEGGKPSAVFTINTDITERTAAEREIQYLAYSDLLTGLPNRRLLMDRLQHALDNTVCNEQIGAVLFIDLDNFKTLNDTMGHDKGDILLKQVAARLSACVPEGNIVGRLGGDEFIILLEELSEQAADGATYAKAVAEKILAAFEQPFDLGGYSHLTTPSIGIALFDQHVNEIDELLKRADLAMYQAKAAGRNAVRFFDPQMQTVVNRHMELEADLRKALRCQEFALWYQAQTDQHGHIIGAEALLRWQHPRHGQVTPSDFIAMAEQTGLILPLGQWVLETACGQLAAWKQRPETAALSIAVNISARQFHHAEFVEHVLRVLAETGATPQRLKLELAESLLIDDMEQAIEKMNALKAVGIGFSLDDFGTGYSSLSYLKKLPLEQLKIDRSFVDDVLTDGNDAAIARTVIALGEILGLKVIAEGVETEEQHRFLAENGCHVYQGYLFSQPLPAKQFESLIRNRRLQ
jgi:diguanylate cyclase (GGDEF)-like protein